MPPLVGSASLQRVRRERSIQVGNEGEGLTSRKSSIHHSTRLSSGQLNFGPDMVDIIAREGHHTVSRPHSRELSMETVVQWIEGSQTIILLNLQISRGGEEESQHGVWCVVLSPPTPPPSQPASFG